jgi:hypothetical protein
MENHAMHDTKPTTNKPSQTTTKTTQEDFDRIDREREENQRLQINARRRQAESESGRKAAHDQIPISASENYIRSYYDELAGDERGWIMTKVHLHYEGPIGELPDAIAAVRFLPDSVIRALYKSSHNYY